MVSLNWLTQIGELDQEAALRFLHAEERMTPATLATLADAALHRVETDWEMARHWLAVGQRLQAELEPIVGGTSDVPIYPPTPDRNQVSIGYTVEEYRAACAQFYYAHARLAVCQGELTSAEESLHRAQAAWRSLNDEGNAARTSLGLTQILAMQGRYEDAEAVAQHAITLLALPASTPDFARLLQLAGAYHNLATLYVYTERHNAALTTYEQAAALFQQIDQTALDPADAEQLTIELAHNALNRASALTFLDQPEAAERALQQAAADFSRVNDLPNHGRVLTNLGRLYLRTGRYAAALSVFDQATTDLLGERISETNLPLKQLRQADELLLEQAMAFLVMNLLPEAEQALARSEALFRSAEQPYELGQTLYTWGMLRLRATEWATAQPLLAEAAARFVDLQNEFWLNRTHLAQAALAYRRGDRTDTATRLTTLLATLPTAANVDSDTVEPGNVEPAEETANPLSWDIAGLVELRLLQLRLSIDNADFATAETAALALAALLHLDLVAMRALLTTTTTPAPTQSAEQIHQLTGPLPHYALRFHHLLGRLAQRSSDFSLAQAHFQHALLLLEQQRATLLVEEIRTAFLDDKTEVYVDLIQLLLERADDDPALVAAAFATVERARSRALLERLLAATSGSLSEPQTTSPDPTLTSTAGEGKTNGPAGSVPETTSAATPAQVDELRQRLHWLYNQLLGESGSRNLNSRLSEQLLMEEATLQRLEWRRSTLLQQAEPVDLQTFQAALSTDQQAIVYTILGNTAQWETNVEREASADVIAEPPGNEMRGAEVVAFLIDRNSIQVFRQLTDTARLQQALDELRFQLGRAEFGKAYLARHQERLRVRLHEVLLQLYELLVAPLRPLLTTGRLLFVPAGALHRLPFHALWDGTSYLVENYECSYAPSASVVALRRRRGTNTHIQSWAGLAVNDAAIPAARMEVTGVARYFADAHLYLDEGAGHQGLMRAAQANILHLATHGLFRPDNPFFSALKLADGWIDVREIYRLPLQAQLVILSACESGAGQIRGGDEVVGLARGFLGAGASEVLASLWNVHDESAVTLMDHFYYHLIQEEQTRPAAALRAAQRIAIQNEQHPYYWAPFFVIGD